MSDLSFAQPWLLAALPAAAAAFGWWAIANRRAARRAKQVSRRATAGPPYVAAFFLAVAAVAAVLAAAGPRWGNEQRYLPRQGAETIFVLDVSRSMDAKDIQPSRLAAAKQAITKTLTRLNGDRVGLVMFAGDARLRIPLTADLAAATQVIATLETGNILVQGGTSASTGLDIALNAFEKTTAATAATAATADTAGKLIVFLSDGDDLGADPAGAAERVKASGVQLIVAGLGTPQGATVPVFDARTRTTVAKVGADGQPIVTRLNEPFLRALAVASGGRYVGADPTTLPGAIEGQVATLKRQRIDERPTAVPVERFQWFGAMALLFALLASVSEYVRGGVRRSAVAALAAAGVLFAACATEAHDLNEQGREALEKGDTQRAIDLFVTARTRRPDDPEISLNLALAYEAGGRHDEASQAARRVLGYSDAVLRGRAQAAVGHFEFAAGRLEQSLGAFRQALIENPDDAASRHDFEVVARLLNPPQKPQPEPGQDPNQSGPDPGATPPSGSGRPGNGAGGTPGPGTSGTPTPGGGGASGALGTPAPGQGSGQASGDSRDPVALQRQIQQLDQEVARLLQEAGDTPTAAQALQILQDLAERNRLTQLRDGLAGGGNPKDY